MFISPHNGIPVARHRFEGYLKILKENNISIDAIVCVGGLVAFGAGNVILESNLRIPDDVIFGEFGENRIILTLGIPFYSVKQNPYQIGTEAVNLFIKCLNDDAHCSESLNVVI